MSEFILGQQKQESTVVIGESRYVVGSTTLSAIRAMEAVQERESAEAPLEERAAGFIAYLGARLRATNGGPSAHECLTRAFESDGVGLEDLVALAEWVADLTTAELEADDDDPPTKTSASTTSGSGTSTRRRKK